jgi:hypothetical protein
MTEQSHAYAARQIQIGVSGVIIDGAGFAAHDGQWALGIPAGRMLIFNFGNALHHRRHRLASSSFPCVLAAVPCGLCGEVVFSVLRP